MVHFLGLARDLAKVSPFGTRGRMGAPSGRRSHTAVGMSRITAALSVAVLRAAQSIEMRPQSGYTGLIS
jgi:hypothetical protein